MKQSVIKFDLKLLNIRQIRPRNIFSHDKSAIMVWVNKKKEDIC